MSVTRWYKFNEDTAGLGTDSSGNLTNLTNVGVTSVIDPTYGNVAYFDGTSSYFILDNFNIPANMKGGFSRAMSFWVKPDSSSLTAGLLTYGSDANSGGRYALRYISGTKSLDLLFFNFTANTTSSNSITTGAWNHVTTVFNTTGNLSKIYINGVESQNVSNGKNINTNSNAPLYIGRYGEVASSVGLTGCMVDMKFYDDFLDDAAILALYTAGPDVSPSLDAVMYTHVADITWDAVSGASTYRITSDENSSGEVNVDDGITGTSITARNLVPGTSYEFKMYSDLDPLVSVSTTTGSTPVVDATSVGSLLTRFSNNFVELSESSSMAIDDINSSLRDVLSTGEVVHTSLGETVFVEDSDTLAIPSVGASVLTPFEASLGSSQIATMTLDDASTNIVTYDESTNEIIYDGNNVAVGSYAIIGGYKMNVKEI